MARVYETPKGGLVEKIVLTTNNQNRISNRDLRANDAVQVDMERGFALYDLLYERKQREHDSMAKEPGQIVANEAVGQWYLAVVLKNAPYAMAATLFRGSLSRIHSGFIANSSSSVICARDGKGILPGSARDSRVTEGTIGGLALIRVLLTLTYSIIRSLLVGETAFAQDTTPPEQNHV